MSEKKSKSLCRWCDTQVNSIITVKDKGRVVWIGCADCYIRKEKKKNDPK